MISNTPKLIFIVLSVFLCHESHSQKTICEILDLEYCNSSGRALTRSSSASFPSSTTAALNNPSSLSMEKGFGLESILYKNVARIGIVSGSGRIGAAISKSPAEETFFSHYALESNNSFRQRKVSKDVHSPDNLSFAMAFNIFGKKKRTGLQLDFGIIYKRNGAKEADYTGAGATLSLNKVFSIGYAVYDDVFYEDRRGQMIDIVDQYGQSTLTYFDTSLTNLTDIDVKVESLILGLKFGNLAIDHLTLKTTYQDNVFAPTYIKIFNTSLFYKKWIFSYGLREEESFREQYQDEVFSSEKFKYDGFIGAQYALNKAILIGLYSNYYLLNELTMGMTIFI
jgi:hypothetical protein